MNYKVTFNDGQTYEFTDNYVKANDGIIQYSDCKNFNLSDIGDNVVLSFTANSKNYTLAFSNKDAGTKIYELMKKCGSPTSVNTYTPPKNEDEIFEDELKGKSLEELLKVQIKLQRKTSKDLRFIKILYIVLISFSVLIGVIGACTIGSLSAGMYSALDDYGSHYDNYDY